MGLKFTYNTQAQPNIKEGGILYYAIPQTKTDYPPVFWFYSHGGTSIASVVAVCVDPHGNEISQNSLNTDILDYSSGIFVCDGTTAYTPALIEKSIYYFEITDNSGNVYRSQYFGTVNVAYNTASATNGTGAYNFKLSDAFSINIFGQSEYPFAVSGQPANIVQPFSFEANGMDAPTIFEAVACTMQGNTIETTVLDETQLILSGDTVYLANELNVTGLCENTLYYLHVSDGVIHAYSDLFITISASTPAGAIMLEDGNGFILLESGDYLLQE